MSEGIGEVHEVTEQEIAYVRRCIDTDVHLFYTWQKWLSKRAEILAMDKYECQVCRKKHHKYTKATTVHHVLHLKARPELALETWYHDPATHEDRRQLVSLCHDCHEEAHGYRKKNNEEQLTEERWD